MNSIVKIPELPILRRRQRRGPVSALVERGADVTRKAGDRVGLRSVTDSKDRARARRSYVIAVAGVAAAALAAGLLLQRSRRQGSEDDVPAPDAALSAGDGQARDPETTQQSGDRAAPPAAADPGHDEAVSA